MLASIHIKNFALIEELSLDFSAGMTVITGETGAGKSIVIDALGLALGERGDTSVIRHHCERADISASFLLAPGSSALEWLAQQALDESEECIMRRVLQKEGRSRCFINGRSVTLNMLRELGELLVDIHGQHAHQSLLKSSYQLALLDELLDNKKALQQVRQYASDYHKVTKELQSLKAQAQQGQERAELLSYQLEELSELNLSVTSIQQLERDHHKAANAQELSQLTQDALYQLYERDSSLEQQLAMQQELLNQKSVNDQQLSAISELLQSAATYVQEAVTELRHYQDDLESDPNYFQQLDQQLSLLHTLARKHKVDMSQLPEVEANIQQELQQLESAQANTSELELQLEKIAIEYHVAAASLSKSRAKTAKKLAKEVTTQMHLLGMEGGTFEARLQKQQQAFARSGSEWIEFYVSANPGHPLQPLSKVASGGEISRISLAIQVITAQKKVTPCLIFDEVDVGIGGQTADCVGRMLESIAQHAQVLCVTHQPQVAARGRHHLQAAKSKTKHSTQTHIQRLLDQQRVEEIARMVGGHDITPSSLQHAESLLTA